MGFDMFDELFFQLEEALSSGKVCVKETQEVYQLSPPYLDLSKTCRIETTYKIVYRNATIGSVFKSENQATGINYYKVDDLELDQDQAKCIFDMVERLKGKYKMLNNLKRVNGYIV